MLHGSCCTCHCHVLLARLHALYNIISFLMSYAYVGQAYGMRMIHATCTVFAVAHSCMHE